jgi:hypothetical protein
MGRRAISWEIALAIGECAESGAGGESIMGNGSGVLISIP